MKSNYAKEEINHFLNQKYKEKITLFSIREGQESQVYWYNHQKHAYIIRINPNEEGFQKDLYAYEHFSSNCLPVPKIVEIGNFHETHFFCISYKIDGTTYEDSDEKIMEKSLPDITDVLMAISETDISTTSGIEHYFMVILVPIIYLLTTTLHPKSAE